MNWTVYRITVAHLEPEDLVTSAAAVEVYGTSWESLGAGAGWGVEHGATFESAAPDGARISEWARATLEANGESAAYVTRDGAAPLLLWSDGSVSLPDGSARVFPVGPALEYRF